MDRIKTEVLNRLSADVESQKTISPAWCKVWCARVIRGVHIANTIGCVAFLSLNFLEGGSCSLSDEFHTVWPGMSGALLCPHLVYYSSLFLFQVG